MRNWIYKRRRRSGEDVDSCPGAASRLHMIIRNRSRGVVDYGYFMRKPIQKLFTTFAVAAALLLQSYLIAEAHASFGFPVIPEEKEKSGQDSELFSDNDTIGGSEKYPSAKKRGLYFHAA